MMATIYLRRDGGADTLDGGAGIDTATYFNSGLAVNVYLMMVFQIQVGMRGG